MNKEDMNRLIEGLRKKNPLIHHITNQVTINDCANMTLALGASPIMAMDPKEVQEVTSLSQSLVLNMGTLSERNLEAMIISGQIANELNIPIILDPVGIGVSKFRIHAVEKILENIKVSIIKGNQSEIKTLGGISACFKGVDSLENDSVENISNITIKLSNTLDTVVACTGKVDIIGFHSKCIYIEDGNNMLGKITGTGCMLASLMGSYAAITSKMEQVAEVGIISMHMAGKKAYKRMIDENRGSGSFKVFLLDEIYKM